MAANRALAIWTVYDGVSDSKEMRYCARRYGVSERGETWTDELLISDNLAEIRSEMAYRGLVCLQRFEQDDAHIVEVWL